jgi:integrase
MFQKIVKAAGVRRITFHGLRHTSATLLLGAGEPVHAIAGRVGLKNANVTFAAYAHALPSQQRSAAANLGALLASGK